MNEKVKRLLKIVIKVIIALIILIPIVLILFVRFQNLSVSGGDKILFGYDENKGRFQFLERKIYELDGIDGPYLLNNKIIIVTEQNKVTEKVLAADSIEVKVNNTDKDKFFVHLRKDFSNPADEYPMPNKLVAISDIEGNFEGFSSLLQKNNVIDDEFNWIFEDGHLVLSGDMVDRGSNVIPTLWLIYKLEQEAEQKGGKVHFILGNHEIMNIQGNFSYAKDKYKKIAELIGQQKEAIENNRIIFSENSHLGKWLRSRNIMEKIGDYIFVHAGLSPEILPLNLSISEINKITRKNIDFNLYRNPNNDKKASFLMGVQSPFWYRGLVSDYKYYDKINTSQLSEILNRYNSKKIVIGHTVVEDISTDFGGKVIRIDIKHGKSKFSGDTKALLIENGKEYKINDLGTIQVINKNENY